MEVVTGCYHCALNYHHDAAAHALAGTPPRLLSAPCPPHQRPDALQPCTVRTLQQHTGSVVSRELNRKSNRDGPCQPAIIRYYIFALSLVRCVWFVCGPKSASRLLYMYEVHIKENNTCTGTSTVRYTCTLSVHGTAVRYLPYIKNTASTRAEEQMSFPFEGVGRPDAIAVLYLDMIAEKSVAMSEFFTHFAYRTLIPSLHLLPID